MRRALALGIAKQRHLQNNSLQLNLKQISSPVGRQYLMTPIMTAFTQLGDTDLASFTLIFLVTSCSTGRTQCVSRPGHKKSTLSPEYVSNHFNRPNFCSVEANAFMSFTRWADTFACSGMHSLGKVRKVFVC
jgi:hypothetical protein